MPRRGFRYEFVRDIELRPAGIQRPVPAYHAVQREQNGFADEFAFGEGSGNPVSHQGIALFLQLPAGDAETTEVNVKAPVVAQFFRNKTAAASAAEPRDMAMHVDNAGGERLHREVGPGE